jgi:hypothetical protein
MGSWKRSQDGRLLRTNLYVTLKVKQEGYEDVKMTTSVKMTTEMRELKNNFCDWQGLQPQSVRFMFEGIDS